MSRWEFRSMVEGQQENLKYQERPPPILPVGFGTDNDLMFTISR